MSRPTSRIQARNNHSKKITLKEMMALRKKQLEDGDLPIPDSVAVDPYEICYKYLEDFRKTTLVGTETEVMCDHKNDWDENHPESAARLYEIINRIATLCLLTRCDVLPFETNCPPSDVLLIHSNDLFETLKRVSKIRKTDEREQEATKYDGVYFSRDTFKAAMRALTWTINVTKQVCQNKYHNGFALVRPPGHHARHEAFEGYCFFNNVAIAAEKCLKEKLCKKILIVDFDVHHGDGTQEAFYERNDVLYFSMHRYENGLFWPNLREGNFDYIGKDGGKGYNVNVPINKIGARDTDYLAIIFNLLLPIAYEFHPDLVMISAGYDAAVGCPEGQMLLTPGFYSHIVQLLSGIADGHIVMVLEGGYFIPSLCESTAMSIKGLLNDPCPLLEETGYVQQSIVETINNCKGVLYNHWNCFSVVQRFEYMPEYKINPHEEHIVAVKYFGEVEKPPYTTRDYYPEHSQLAIDDFTSFISRFRSNEANYKTYQGTGYAYESVVLLHAPDKKAHSYEDPARLMKILDLMEESQLTKRCIEIKVPKDRDDYQYCLEVHKDYFLERFMSNSLKPLHDLYINKHTAKAAMTSVSVLLTVVDAVITEKVTNGVALIRPPGHHATADKAQGFCFLNNVAIAAKYAKQKYNVPRILIVDFDIHHGNGTQDVFYNSSDVLYISIHRFDNGSFYPFNASAGAKFVGHGPGEGFNVNIPFNNEPMGNSEYLAAFLNIILPIAYAFKPELVLVSAGFDAGINDPLGGYNVTPEMYGQFIYLLKPLASGKIIVALEGGYNVNTTGYGMLMCMKALRGESVPVPDDVFAKYLNKNAAETIREVVAIQQQYWPSLNVMKHITNKVFHCRYNREFKEEIYSMDKFDVTDVEC
ncbi:histone deacetylase 6 isoform X2 [Coccinella septempunctata]|nr:histone deacetylase 6 isoform X2 [Coccinella septempunctata]XP_044765635.1 histone deacetylase 6 isoform X2 [Coccinella septempunctata]